MTRPVSQIIADIEDFTPSGADWRKLDVFLDELFQSGSASLGVSAMLNVFERFPTQDGNGVFWSVVHGLETLPAYETKLFESVRKEPSHFGLLMLNRLLNSECKDFERDRLLSLLDHVGQSPNVIPELRKVAQSFLERHRQRPDMPPL